MSKAHPCDLTPQNDAEGMLPLDDMVPKEERLPQPFETLEAPENSLPHYNIELINTIKVANDEYYEDLEEILVELKSLYTSQGPLVDILTKEAALKSWFNNYLKEVSNLNTSLGEIARRL